MVFFNHLFANLICLGIKEMGDALMVAFEDPLDSVLLAIEMQRELANFNRDQTEQEKEIRIRIGINDGIVS